MRVFPIKPAPPNPQPRGRGRPRIRHIKTLVPSNTLQLPIQPVVRLENILNWRVEPPLIDLTEGISAPLRPLQPLTIEPQSGPSTSSSDPGPSRTTRNPTTAFESFPTPSTSSLSAPQSNVKSIRLSANPDSLTREELYIRGIFMRAHRDLFRERAPSPVLGGSPRLTKK